MRGLRGQDDAERGAVSVIMAIVLVVLLGFTALVVDLGLLYAERAQLQNGADASALGIAQSCASRNPGPNCSASSPLATLLADRNALDGRSGITGILLNTADRRVTVTTGAQDDLGQDGVQLFFAQALGIPFAEVGARASARWGTPVGGPTVFPAAFSICQVQGQVDGSLQRLGLHGSSYANPSCGYGPSGAPVAGGFGWLAQEPGQCGGNINVNTNLGGSGTGNDAPSNCNAVLQHWIDEINAGRKPTVLLPVFDAVSGTGAGANYHIKTFAAFEVQGWKFSGASEGANNLYTFHNTSAHVGAMECRNNCRGIIGTFVTYVSLAEGYQLGAIDQYGARVVRMTD